MASMVVFHATKHRVSTRKAGFPAHHMSKSFGLRRGLQHLKPEGLDEGFEGGFEGSDLIHYIVKINGKNTGSSAVLEAGTRDRPAIYP